MRWRRGLQGEKSRSEDDEFDASYTSHESEKMFKLFYACMRVVILLRDSKIMLVAHCVDLHACKGLAVMSCVPSDLTSQGYCHMRMKVKFNDERLHHRH